MAKVEIDTLYPIVDHMAFSPNERRLAIAFCTISPMGACRDSTLWIWNLETNQTKAIGSSLGAITSLVFSPNGELLATAIENSVVQLWVVDAKSGRDIFPGPKSPTPDLTRALFSPDGNMLITIGRSRIDLWNLQGTLLGSIAAHSEFIADVVINEDGSKLVTLGCDIEDQLTYTCAQSSVRIWRIWPNTGALLAEADRRLASRTFTASECQDYLSPNECPP